jgi:hypothetical protein
MSAFDPLNTTVFDNGRRGEPLPGCDCVQCFGYCMIDRDAAVREKAERAGREYEEIAALLPEPTE